MAKELPKEHIASLFEYLRSREKFFFEFIVILIPVLGSIGFAFVKHPHFLWIAINLSILMLTIGAAYAVILSYNFRYLQFCLSSIEYIEDIRNYLPHQWNLIGRIPSVPRYKSLKGSRSLTHWDFVPDSFQHFINILRILILLLSFLGPLCVRFLVGVAILKTFHLPIIDQAIFVECANSIRVTGVIGLFIIYLTLWTRYRKFVVAYSWAQHLVVKNKLMLKPADSPKWYPQYPAGGEELTICYSKRTAEARHLNSTQDIYLHWAVNDWQLPSKNEHLSICACSNAVKSVFSKDGDGFYHVRIAPDSNVRSINFVITDGLNWDNNSGLDYRIDVGK